eukprot:TRINITY_DN1864_c0_g1_i13.p1 TRINITY_DN1864_c0_g1~~TRINITY_DN1864_c0_g1_i13.p1  ORF type:complete len:259 (+),score=37.00 TRINITY_DN1864_c0_g1_i13:66-842(+)
MCIRDRSMNINFGAQSGIDQVNHWVQKVTNGCIKSIIREPNPLIVTILANAIYFKANWKQQFDVKNTIKMAFTNYLGENHEAQFMYQESKFRFKQQPQVTYLELVYDACPVSMVIAMEKSGQPILGENVDFTNFIQNCGQIATTKAQVWIPKFKIENAHDFNGYFKDSLSEIFVEKMNPKICDTTTTFVSSILHQTFVQVDEQGTEAAAVTSVAMKTRSLAKPDPIPAIRIDKSFHFYIVDHKHKLILFNGFVNHPQF